MYCNKCGSENLAVVKSGPHNKLVCADCLAYQRFLSDADAESFRQIEAGEGRYSETERRLEHLDGQIQIAGLYANYWIAMATTGVVKKRDIYHGTFTGGKQTSLSDEEKIEDALNTARSHIQRMNEALDTKMKLMSEEVTR